MQTKPPKQHRQLMVVKCSARDCRDPARHHVKRRWLLKIKPGLQNQVIDILESLSFHLMRIFYIVNMNIHIYSISLIMFLKTFPVFNSANANIF